MNNSQQDLRGDTCSVIGYDTVHKTLIGCCSSDYLNWVFTVNKLPVYCYVRKLLIRLIYFIKIPTQKNFSSVLKVMMCVQKIIFVR